jgi:hypothetical protein
LDPPEQHVSLWAALQHSDFSWRIEPGSDEERARRVARAGKTVSVAEVAAHAGGGEVFVGSLAARRMRADGWGLRDWVQQPLVSGGFVVRHLHESEVQRLFRTQDVFGGRPGVGSDGCLSWHVVMGASAPWRQLCAAVSGFFAVPFPRVPVGITDVISAEHLLAFRGGMGMAAKDFATSAAAGGTAPAVAYQGGGRGRGRGSTVQPEGGLVFVGVEWPAMFLADYWVSGEVAHIVPMQCVSNPVRVVRSAALRALAGWYPDQEAVGALAGDGVPSKDRCEPGVAVLATNHAASIESASFVDKMYAAELQAGRMSRFGVLQSPPCWPLKVSPTGCVDKTLRNGDVDPENKRPTADYSWPPTGHWMRHMCTSPNAAVDLERDFPFVYMVGAHDLIEQIQYLAALGDGVR